jgi:hypothetical protein
VGCDPPEVPGLRIGHRLGAGGSGTVWAAVRESDGLALAVKVVPCADRDAAVQAAREVAVLAGAGVEGLVRFHGAFGVKVGGAGVDGAGVDGAGVDGAGVDGAGVDGVAIVLDRVEAGSLELAVLARGHLSVGETVTVLTPVARTLAGLHAVGVVHGDLSPANVLLERSGRPLVADLGLARLAGEARTEAWGTDGFAAPEVVAGSPPSTASDVYALGALAWWGATGSAPGPATVRRPLDELAPGLPGSWVETTLRALAADPALRPTAAEAALAYFGSAVAEPLRLVVGADATSLLTQRLRDGAPTGAEQSGTTRRDRRHASSRRPRRRTVVRWAAAVAGLAGMATSTALVALGPLGAAGAGAALPARPTARGTALAPHPALDATTDRDAPARDPRGLMQCLADLRAAAMNSGDPVRLSALDAPSSPALARDTADFAALAASGGRYAGVALHVRTARALTVTEARATLEAVVDSTAYRVVGTAGSRSAAAHAGAPLRFAMVWVRGRWRIERVEAA